MTDSAEEVVACGAAFGLRLEEVEEEVTDRIVLKRLHGRVTLGPRLPELEAAERGKREGDRLCCFSTGKLLGVETW
jgi:hypothetical protein